MQEKIVSRVGIIGGGPSGLFMLKHLLETGRKDLAIHIFEKNEQLGAGMPYSLEGASSEHITNVSDNEIPVLSQSIADWIENHTSEAWRYHIKPKDFSEYKVLPRLLFGKYLSDQFEELLKDAEKQGIIITIHTNTMVNDMKYDSELREVEVFTADKRYIFDIAVVCIGHNWPVIHEGIVPGYFDSPYPPDKLNLKLNCPVAIKGSSLTAIDAIRTLARNNGHYIKNENNVLQYQLHKGSEGFKIVMHSRNGFLPAVRFHLQDSHLQNEHLLTEEELASHRKTNAGFLSLDYVFEKNFKNLFLEKDKGFYEKIKDLSLEDFVNSMMKLREELPPFQLLRAEYNEAEKSIKRKQSIYWKEALGILSIAMNQPAKHFSAEDFLRLKSALLPLISIVIAYLPQSSCEELLALYGAGVLDLIAVGENSQVLSQERGGIIYEYTKEKNRKEKVYFSCYINCVGQAHLPIEKFPFKGLLDGKSLCQATYQFKLDSEGNKALVAQPEEIEVINGQYHLKVSGLAINDYFQVIDKYGAFNPQLYIMAVPYISGYNPDYSGLDFCEAASKTIVRGILNDLE